MATGMYENGVAAIMGADVDLVNDQIAVLLIDKSFYTPDLDDDTSQANIPEAAQIAEVALTSKTIDGTTFRADDSVFVSVTGAKVDAIVVMKDTDNTGTSLLLAFFDDASEFPITPDGTDITVEWSDGANGIFTL